MNKSKKSKNAVKNRWDCVEIFMCACVCVCVCVWASVCVFVWIIVAYYCSWMCKWCLAYVYVKIHAQRDKLEVVYQIGERSCSFAAVEAGKKLFISIWGGNSN